MNHLLCFWKNAGWRKNTIKTPIPKKKYLSLQKERKGGKKEKIVCWHFSFKFLFHNTNYKLIIVITEVFWKNYFVVFFF